MPDEKSKRKETKPGPTAKQLAEIHKGGVYEFANGKLTQVAKPTQPAKPIQE